jgi:predicted hotdog family 3-hydroxylacyl-ACP dehydratase
MIVPRIPHAPPLRLLTGLEEHDQHGCRGIAQVGEGPALADGWVRPAYLVEIAAQAAAAWSAARGDGAPRTGRLVAVSDWRWHADARGGEIGVELTRSIGFDKLTRFDARLRQQDRLLAEGSITVHESE